jgi:large subunit ribosomal protein L23
MSIFDKLTKKKSDNQPAKSVPVDASAVVESKAKAIKPKQEDKFQEAIAVSTKDKSIKDLGVYGVLIKPLITEKSTFLGQLNQYAFMVKKNANKIQISQAFISHYGIKPVKINIINKQGKQVRYGRSVGRTKDWKKAIITLPAGKTIQLHEGV